VDMKPRKDITFKEFLIFLSWFVWIVCSLLVLFAITLIQNGNIIEPNWDFFMRLVGFTTVWSGLHISILANCIMNRIKKEYGNN
jgi:hypothetical protein